MGIVKLTLSDSHILLFHLFLSLPVVSLLNKFPPKEVEASLSLGSLCFGSFLSMNLGIKYESFFKKGSFCGWSNYGEFLHFLFLTLSGHGCLVASW